MTSIPEHYILKPNSLKMNTKISLYADFFSVEEGGGYKLFGTEKSICNLVIKACNPVFVNRRINSFDKQ